MRQWFESLEPRERMILGGGAIIATLIVFWAFIWRPIVTGTGDLRDSVSQKQRLLTDVFRANVDRDGAASTNPSETTSLVVLITNTAQFSGLRTRPDGPNGINVSFQNAPFGVLTDWLIGLQQSNGVYVEVANISSARESGLVNGQVLLRRN